MEKNIQWSEDFKHVKIATKYDNVELHFKSVKQGKDYLNKKGIKV
jgi:hypothetical protein